MYGYIYLIFCDVTKKSYIGARRWKNIKTIHTDSYMGSGTALEKDKLMYGIHHFHKKILAIAFSLPELNRLEKYFIERCNAVNSPQFYNQKAGGGLAPIKS